MALAFNEGGDLHQDIPFGFPSCGDFNFTVEKFNKYIDKSTTRSTPGTASTRSGSESTTSTASGTGKERVIM